MYNYNQLSTINFEGNLLKFESLILLNYFTVVIKKSEFKEKSDDIKTIILSEFKKYYDKHNISKIDEGKEIVILFDEFIPFMKNIIDDKLVDLYQFFLEQRNYNSKLRVINLIEEEFIDEIMKVYFLKSLKIRNKFFQ